MNLYKFSTEEAEELVICPNCKIETSTVDLLPPTSRNNYSMKKGGCTKCSENCSACNRVIDKDYILSSKDEIFCEDCFSEYFYKCDKCSEIIDMDDVHYSETDNASYCNQCYIESFPSCSWCSEPLTEKEQSLNYEVADSSNLCEKCYIKLTNEEYKISDFDFTKKDKFLNELYKILPISVKELKAKYPKLFAGLAELIAFNKGQDLTTEVVLNFRNSLICLLYI